MENHLEYCLLMTLGMSVLDWRDNGSLQREIQPYKLLFEQYKVTTVIFDFSSESEWAQSHDLRQDLKRHGIEIIVLYGNYAGNIRIIKYITALHRFFIYSKSKKQIIIKTNQTKGSHFVSLLKILNKKIFYLHRSGYDYRMFARKIHGYGIKYLLAKVEKYSSNYISDRIHVATARECYTLPEWIRAKTLVLPNWSDCLTCGIRKSEYLIFVGRLVPQKNIIPLLLNFPVDKKLIVIGDGPLASQVDDIAKSRGLLMTQHHSINHPTLLRLIKQSAALICCSDYEGNPKVVIEAIVNGVPVIIKNSIGLKELFPNNTLGIKFDNFDELTDACSDLENFKIDLKVQALFQRQHSLNHLLETEIKLIQDYWN